MIKQEGQEEWGEIKDDLLKDYCFTDVGEISTSTGDLPGYAQFLPKTKYVKLVTTRATGSFSATQHQYVTQRRRKLKCKPCEEDDLHRWTYIGIQEKRLVKTGQQERITPTHSFGGYRGELNFTADVFGKKIPVKIAPPPELSPTQVGMWLTGESIAQGQRIREGYSCDDLVFDTWQEVVRAGDLHRREGYVPPLQRYKQ